MDSYLFQAAPKPVQTRTKKNIYREPDEQKEALAKTQLNLMYDRRVSRGSTYAPSKRTQAPVGGNFRPVQMAGPRTPHAAQPRSGKDQHPLPPSSAAPEYSPPDVDFIRIATPEPVAGRVHSTVQTDTYLEDLRRNKQAQEHDFATQTDAENDRPTAPLFVPRSSGDDVATEIEPDALFDFELEVQAVLGVLVEKSLEQALMEVCEEEEMAELDQHAAAFAQEKNLALVGVQQYIQRDERRKAERERRAKQEAERLAAEKATADQRRAATMAKQLVAGMEASILEKLDAAGAFYDPVKKEVEKIFMPHLLGQTATKLAEYAAACQVLDGMLSESIQSCLTGAQQAGDEADEQEVRDLVAFKLDPATVPRPVKRVMSLVHAAGRSEEQSARSAAHGSQAVAAAAAASPSPALSPEERAQVIVDRILAEREAVRVAEAKRLRDIITIQSLQRGKHDRARAAKLADKRRREAERAAMSPQELLISLRNYLGCEVRAKSSLSSASAPSLEEKEDSAPGQLVVYNISALGPASQAGLVAGDCILSINGVLVDSALSLSPAALKEPPHSLNPGDSVTIQVARLTTDGRVETLQLELSTDEDGYDHAAVRALREDADLPAAEVRWLSADEANEALEALPGKLGATPATMDQKGCARLTKITADSPAARGGLRDSDIVVAVNRAAVTDYKQVASAVKELLAGEVLELTLLAPEARDKVNGGAPISLRSMATEKKLVELGGGGKKLTIEGVRRLRRIAGLRVFGEQQTL